MKPTAYAQALGRERSVSAFIPQSSHISDTTIVTRDGDLQRTWKVRGIPFETVDPIDVHTPKEQLNTLIRSMGSAKVSLWQHTIHRRAGVELPAFSGGYSGEFNARYASALEAGEAFNTELYLTAVYRPAPSRTIRAIVRAGRRSTAEILAEQAQALKALDDISHDIESALSRYQPEVLGIYTDDNGAACSSALSFLNYLVCGSWQSVQVPTGPIHDVLGDAYLHVGTDTIEIHSPIETQYAKCVEFKDYNARTQPGMLDELLYQPYEFVITQSFSLLDKIDGVKTLERQKSHLISTEDAGASQVGQMESAIDELIAGHFCIGEYHFTLMVFAGSAEQATINASSAMSTIKDKGFIACLSTTATDAAWYAQLPCNWFYRPRVAWLTSRNFAALAGLHSFPAGKKLGNPWGDALTVFKTPSGQPYYFNFHACSDNEDYTGKRLLGNTRIIGKSGVGKTVLLNTLFLQAQRYAQGGKYSSVFFDIDQAAKQTIEAAGGKYLVIENGEPTGLNPFQMEATESNILFVESLVRTLATDDGQPITTTDGLRISQGVRTVMKMPVVVRRLSVLLQNLTGGSTVAERENSLTKRLVKWCADDGHGNKGSLSWVLDCERDAIDLTTHSNYGFDGTAFLDNAAVRTPITLYLLHRIRSMIDGRRFVLFMDEAFRYLDDSAFIDFAGDEQPTIRKKNGLLVMATQSPSTVLKSSISAQLVEQVATQIYLPNPQANETDYCEGFGLTNTEFRVIQSLPEDSRLFLVKQHNASVVAHLNLNGLDDDLAILSNAHDKGIPA